MFLGFQKKWGGGPGDATFEPRDGMAPGTPFHFPSTYIHACIQPGPGETIINLIFLAEIFLGLGLGGTRHPF